MNNFKVNNFPIEVIKEIKFYVYRLIDPRNGETFYVGKGEGNRLFQHLKCAISEKEEIEDETNLKYFRIREILNCGLEIIHVIHRHGLDSETAFEVEAALIDAYPNTTNKSNGHNSNAFGPMNAFEILTNYKAETAILKHNLIMININRTINHKDTYDAVRFSWKLDIQKAKQAELVLAVEKGIIVGVFKPLEWKKATIENFPGFDTFTTKRIGFNGIEAELETKNEYIRKRVPEEFRKKGASNPVKYFIKS